MLGFNFRGRALHPQGVAAVGVPLAAGSLVHRFFFEWSKHPAGLSPSLD